MIKCIGMYNNLHIAFVLILNYGFRRKEKMIDINALKQMRLTAGFSMQKDLAARIGTRQSAISAVETGTVTPGQDLIIKWSNACGFDTLMVIEGSGVTMHVCGRFTRSHLSGLIRMADMDINQLTDKMNLSVTGIRRAMGSWNKSPISSYTAIKVYLEACGYSVSIRFVQR